MSFGDLISTAARRTRILFVAEAVTLAHVTRPVVLARSLDPSDFDVHLACDPRYLSLFGELPFAQHPLFTMPTADFLAALRRIGPIFRKRTLRAYVQDELDVIARVKPDLIVGDFRVSLAVSARLAKTPYCALVNGYWSPYTEVPFHMPDVWLSRLLGPRLADAMFTAMRERIFTSHAAALNQICREYGLAPVGNDLREVFTYGDYTLYPDLPELLPMVGLPDTHQFIGPILWSPAVGLPDWWGKVPLDRPVVYVTLGSSGEGSLLYPVLDALANQDLSVIAAAAGPFDPARIPANAWVADYLPGDQAAARASIVVCNGGSPTVYQALAAGRPVLGLAANMDQQLNMECIQRSGAGQWLRAMEASPTRVCSAVNAVLGDRSYSDAAVRLQAACADQDVAKNFHAFLGRAGGRGDAPQPAG